MCPKPNIRSNNNNGGSKRGGAICIASDENAAITGVLEEYLLLD